MKNHFRTVEPDEMPTDIEDEVKARFVHASKVLREAGPLLNTACNAHAVLTIAILDGAVCGVASGRINSDEGRAAATFLRGMADKIEDDIASGKIGGDSAFSSMN